MMLTFQEKVCKVDVFAAAAAADAATTTGHVSDIASSVMRRGIRIAGTHCEKGADRRRKRLERLSAKAW